MDIACKTICSLLLVLFFLQGRPTLAQQFDNAVEYMSFMGDESRKIGVDMMQYVSASAHSRRARKIEKRRKELVNTTVNARKKIAKMPPYDGDVLLRDAVVECLTLAEAVFAEDYLKIIDMEEVAARSYDLMETYLAAVESASRKLKNAYTDLNAAQRDFAIKHRIALVEDKSNLARQMEVANKVNQYNNQLYLVMFKSYVAELALMDMVSEQDLEKMRDYHRQLLGFSEEGLRKLESMPDYEGDKSLIESCDKVLRFYIDACADDYNTLIDFYDVKQQFESAKSRLDKMKPGKRTQADIDAFNGLVEEYNGAINTFNQTNTQLNQKREHVLNAYNQAAAQFLDRHIPKYR